MCGRRLAERAGERRQRRFDLRALQSNRLFCDDVAFGIVRRRDHAEAHVGAVMLVRFEQKPRELGRFAKTDRQEPRCRGIECAGVARLFGVEQALGALERSVRREPDRFVEQQDPVDATTRDFRRHGQFESFLSAATASSINFDRRMPLSIESS